jgi:hypothetical protein
VENDEKSRRFSTAVEEYCISNQRRINMVDERNVTDVIKLSTV